MFETYLFIVSLVVSTAGLWNIVIKPSVYWVLSYRRGKGLANSKRELESLRTFHRDYSKLVGYLLEGVFRSLLIASLFTVNHILLSNLGDIGVAARPLNAVLAAAGVCHVGIRYLSMKQRVDTFEKSEAVLVRKIETLS